MLEIGTKAPNFTLPNKDGEDISLSNFKGKKVILYFYPKDNTPGCTKQANTYKEHFDSFVQKDAIIIGISKDSVKSHLNFATKYDLPFILLSDEDLDAIKKYDVWKEKKLYGKAYMGVVRTTYLINEEGIIVKAMENVKPDQDALNMVCSL